MTAFNPAGPPANTQAPSVNPLTGAQIVDPTDEIVASVSTPDTVQPLASAGGYAVQTTQVLVAILIELRVLNSLVQANSAPNLDLGSLRADESGGASGGLL